MKNLFFLVIVTLMIISCSKAPSDSAIQTAIAKTRDVEVDSMTKTVNPTATYTIAPSLTLTSTPSPSATPMPTNTPTLTVTPTVTPDIRVIDVDPKEFLLTRQDLPSEAKYYLPNSNWISPHRNSEVVSGWGVDEGRKYLAETGRIDGWWVYYLRGTVTVIAPEEVYDNVVIYKTVEGALLVITKYSSCSDRDTGYIELETAPKIGDYSKTCVSTEMQSSGENRVWYRIEFVYRNYYHDIVGYGWENDVEPKFVESIALVLLKKLQNAPLSEEVKYSP